MAYRVLEVTLLSAKDLKNVNLIMRMAVYAVVTISGEPLTRQCTQPDPYGGSHPSWNATLRFEVPPTASAAGGCLHVLLRAERALGDRDIGEVIVPLSEIFADVGADDLGPRRPQCASYQVRKVHRSEPRGVLSLSYRLGPVVEPVPHHARADKPQPVVAFPASPPPQPPPYTYLPPPPPPPPPPQAAVNVVVATLEPPQAAGGHVAAPPLPKAAGNHVAAASPRTGKQNGKLGSGMGRGAGLGGGAIGGMLAGEMTSDTADYNAGTAPGWPIAEGPSSRIRNAGAVRRASEAPPVRRPALTVGSPSNGQR